MDYISVDVCNKKCNNMCKEKCIKIYEDKHKKRITDLFRNISKIMGQAGVNRKKRVIMRNNTYIRLETVYRKLKGYVGTRELLKEGFSNRQIAVLTEEGYLEKICHGFYWLNGREYEKPTDFKCIEICLSAPGAVICMDSALYYQGVIEEEPERLSVATERTDRSLINLNFPVNRHYFSETNFAIGLKNIKTEFGCYHIYDIERSVCDIKRLKAGNIDRIVSEIRRSEKQYKRLLKYMELFSINGVL